MNQKIIGIVLLWSGFIAGSLATVWNAPRKGVEFAGSLKTSEQAIPLVGQNVVRSAVIPVSILEAGKEPEESAIDRSVANLKIVEGFTPNILAQEPVGTDGWHLINWTWYAVAAVIGVVGIVLIRQGQKASNQKSETTEASLSEVKESLRRLVQNVNQLAKDAKKLAPSKILSRIDEELSDDFLVFADGRESITVEHGLAIYADVMSSFASGERAVNRAWCAAADGYVNEAEDCLDRASQMLQDASKILEAN